MKGTTASTEIAPEINGVHLEHIGEEAVIKVLGNDMWFVYQLSIDNMSVNDVSIGGKYLPVDVIKSSGYEVQTRIKAKNISCNDKVRVRVETHFKNPKYLAPTMVKANKTVS